jgi:hypothetical protein
MKRQERSVAGRAVGWLPSLLCLAGAMAWPRVAHGTRGDALSVSLALVAVAVLARPGPEGISFRTRETEIDERGDLLLMWQVFAFIGACVLMLSRLGELHRIGPIWIGDLVAITVVFVALLQHVLSRHLRRRSRQALQAPVRGRVRAERPLRDARIPGMLLAMGVRGHVDISGHSSSDPDRDTETVRTTETFLGTEPFLVESSSGAVEVTPSEVEWTTRVSGFEDDQPGSRSHSFFHVVPDGGEAAIVGEIAHSTAGHSKLRGGVLWAAAAGEDPLAPARKQIQWWRITLGGMLLIALAAAAHVMISLD